MKKEYQTVFSKVTASEETREKILNMKYENASYRGLPFRRIAGVCVVVMALMGVTVTAIAGATGAEWFTDLFSVKADRELSQSEINFVSENTVELRNSVTHDGYTVSVEYAITDGYTAYIKVKVTGPEGKALDADDYGFVYQGKSQFYPADESNPSRTGSWQLMDEDREDNVVYFPMVWRGSGFADGSKWILELEDLYESQPGSDGFRDDTVIADGVFRFELVLSDISHEAVELLAEPLQTTAKVYNTESDFEEVDIGIMSIILRPLSATIEFESDTDASRLAGFAQLTIYMKDGSVTQMNMGSSGNGINQYSTNTPVIFDDVDYILLPDGTKVPMPD